MERAGLQPTVRFSRAAQVWLVLILLAGFGLRVQSLALQDIWWDEARNLDVAIRPLAQIAGAPELDIHPPVYFWFLHGWTRLLDVAPDRPPQVLAYAGRMLSVMAGVAGIALTAVLGRWLSPGLTGVVAGLLAAASPFWIAESQETRMYTLGFAELALAAVAWLALERRRHGKASAYDWSDWVLWAIFVFAVSAALTTHYNALFIVFAWYAGWVVVMLLRHDRWRALRTPALTGLSTLLLISPAIPIALRQVPGYANPNLSVPSPFDYLAQNWRAYWAGYAYDPSLATGLAPIWLWAALLLVLIGLSAALLHRELRPVPLSLYAVWTFAGLALYYVAVIDRGAFNVRYSSFVTPSLYVLCAAGIAGWSFVWRPLGPVVAALALVLWPWTVHADLYDPRFAREDIAGVASWLRGQAGPNDLILVDQKYPIGFYYQRYAIDPEDMPVGPETAPARYLFVDINTIDRRLNQWAGDAERVFWVQWYESDTDPRRAVSFLLDKAGTRGGEEWFQGYSVDWWALHPPTTFALAPSLAPLSLTFSPAVRTIELSLPDGFSLPGAMVPVVIRWARVPDGVVTRPLKARVALYAADGARVAQADERLLNDRHLLPSEWALADQPLNVYRIVLPEDLPDGAYSVGLLVYDAETLEPLGAVDAAGNQSGVEAFIGHIDVTTQ